LRHHTTYSGMPPSFAAKQQPRTMLKSFEFKGFS
jgi:hypothetical protein